MQIQKDNLCRLTLYVPCDKIILTKTNICTMFETCVMYQHIPSMPWEGLENKGCKTLSVSRANMVMHTWRILTCLPYSLPSLQLALVQTIMLLKKQLACSCCSQSHFHSDIGLLTHDISDFGKDSGHYSCHSVKCKIPKGLRRIFRDYTYKAHTLLGCMERISSRLQYVVLGLQYKAGTECIWQRMYTFC